MKRNNKPILCFSVAVLSALILAPLCGLRAAPQQAPTQPQVLSNAVVNEPLQFDVSPPLSQMVRQAPVQQGTRLMHAPLRPKQQLLGAHPSQAGGAAGALQPSAGPLISATIGLTFEGVGNTAVNNCPSVSGITVAPPDTNAAVGDTQVVQWVNLCYAIFNKTTGALIAGPFAGNDFWAGFGGGCQADNDGDPIIQFDKMNHVWVASQNDFGPGFGGPFQTCIAVSTTADATGTYNRYAFPQSAGFPDFPKWGLTPNIYYQTQNTFGSVSFLGVNVCAYNVTPTSPTRRKPQQVCILDNSNGTLFDDSMLPADLDSDPHGATVPPEVLLGSIDNFIPGDTHVYEYVFTVDFDHNPRKSTATLAGVNGTMKITVPAFALGCGGFGACIEQPSPGSGLLDSLGDRLSYRLALFNDGTTQHFVVVHSVNDTAATAVRWYEFTAPSGSTSLSLAQSGNTPDDSEFRWMGSAAMDHAGDILIGYSRSSAAAGDFPSVYFTGRTAADPAGTLEAEALIKQGSGSQFDTASRWGDYSSMSLDAADHCTMWHTTEYYPADGRFAWATWIASLRFPASTCP